MVTVCNNVPTEQWHSCNIAIKILAKLQKIMINNNFKPINQLMQRGLLSETAKLKKSSNQISQYFSEQPLLSWTLFGYLPIANIINFAINKFEKDQRFLFYLNRTRTISEARPIIQAGVILFGVRAKSAHSNGGQKYVIISWHQTARTAQNKLIISRTFCYFAKCHISHLVGCGF